jgi:hypothetical protein
MQTERLKQVRHLCAQHGLEAPLNNLPAYSELCWIQHAGGSQNCALVVGKDSTCFMLAFLDKDDNTMRYEVTMHCDSSATSTLWTLHQILAKLPTTCLESPFRDSFASQGEEGVKTLLEWYFLEKRLLSTITIAFWESLRTLLRANSATVYRELRSNRLRQMEATRLGKDNELDQFPAGLARPIAERKKPRPTTSGIAVRDSVFRLLLEQHSLHLLDFIPRPEEMHWCGPSTRLGQTGSKLQIGKQRRANHGIYAYCVGDSLPICYEWANTTSVNETLAEQRLAWPFGCFRSNSSAQDHIEALVCWYFVWHRRLSNVNISAERIVDTLQCSYDFKTSDGECSRSPAVKPSDMQHPTSPQACNRVPSPLASY